MNCMTDGCQRQRVQDSGWCRECLTERWMNRETLARAKDADELARDAYDADLTDWVGGDPISPR